MHFTSSEIENKAEVESKSGESHPQFVAKEIQISPLL